LQSRASWITVNISLGRLMAAPQHHKLQHDISHNAAVHKAG
jgi:hypothetical protein